MNAPLLQVRALGKRFGGFVALSGIDVSVARAERVGLIGPNGSGKSTFVNCLGGFFAWHEGDIEFDGAALNGVPAYRRAKLGLARTFQLPRAFASLTVAENVEIPLRFLGSDGPIYVRAREGLERVGLAGKANSRPGNRRKRIFAASSLPVRLPAARSCSSPTKPWRVSHTRRSTRSWRSCSQSTLKEWPSS